jgi:hypothetical protein
MFTDETKYKLKLNKFLRKVELSYTVQSYKPKVANPGSVGHLFDAQIGPQSFGPLKKKV